VCNSSFENYKKYIPEINKKHIIYNTLSTTVLDKNILGNNKIIKENGILYLAIIGTIEKRKNQQNFINNVFYRLKNKFCNIKLLLVGEEREKLNIIQSYHKDIIVLGLVNNALPYINMSDIIISYSINEVLPLNIIESFYCSKPVVSSDVGGIKEMINDKNNGYLFKTNDSNACFDILCNLIENKSLIDEIGNNAKKTFLNKFDEKNVIGKFLSLLDYTNL
jgi:glycosyltransferase involved in cell wall biosynthesis